MKDPVNNFSKLADRCRRVQTTVLQLQNLILKLNFAPLVVSRATVLALFEEQLSLSIT